MTDSISHPQTLPSDNDRRARRNTWVLVAAQAILGSQITMVFTIGGLAGQMLAPNACLATLPISLIVLGSMTTAPWLSPLMSRMGRRAGFLIGAGGGAIGSMIGIIALLNSSFELLLVGSYFTGIYQSAQGFYRFAAADTATPAFRPKAISYVLAGGLVSAIIGPQLVTITSEAYIVPFVGTYVVALVINILGSGLFFLLDIPKPAPQSAAVKASVRRRGELLADPVIRVAIICGMVSYALMNLVMTSTPLAVVGCGFDTADAANVVSAHVIAMFLPSFFTGHLIARFGTTAIITTGLLILAGAGVVAMSGVGLAEFFVALMLLGVGWNFGFIGATTMLSNAAHRPEERGVVQGLNDLMVFGCVMLASLASGGLMNCSGGNTQEGWIAVNLAMVPFLMLAGAALIWLHLRPKDETPA